MAETSIVKDRVNKCGFIKGQMNEHSTTDNHRISFRSYIRGRIVAYRDVGLSYREIGRRVNCTAMTVMRVCRVWREEGRGARRRPTGRPRRTTERQDRRFRQLALRDRFATTRQIADQWFREEGRPVTMRTLYRRIRAFGLFSYRPRLVLPLTADHCRQRLNWCRERNHWEAEWHNVVFSDESRFCLGMHDGRRRVRRRRGERHDIGFVVERHVHRTVGVMVWGAIAYGSRSPLLFIRGSMTAARYVNEVLQATLLPYLDDRPLRPQVLFQQDNARPHIARQTMDFLQQAGVNLLPWPPRSPDLNPIEHVWDMMGRRLSNLHHPPQTLAQLIHEVQLAWNEVPQADIDHLILSVPRRVHECIQLRGRQTHY